MDETGKSYLSEARNCLDVANKALHQLSTAMAAIWPILDEPPVSIPVCKPIDHSFYYKNTSRDSTALFYIAPRRASSGLQAHAHTRGFDSVEALSKEYNISSAFIFGTFKMQPEVKELKFRNYLLLLNKNRIMELIKERGLMMSQKLTEKRLGSLLDNAQKTQ